jgi:hypothetical protein
MNKLPTEQQLPGWYLRANHRAMSGVIWEFRLSLLEDGAPITPKAAARILDGESPSSVSPGQWKFVFQEWKAEQADEFTFVSKVDTQPKRGESSTVPKVKTVSHEDDTTQADLALALSVMQTRLTSLEEDLIETRAERSDFARTIREQGASIDGIMQHVRALESRKPEAAARGDGELRVFVPRWCIKMKQVETWSHSERLLWQQVCSRQRFPPSRLSFQVC